MSELEEFSLPEKKRVRKRWMIWSIVGVAAATLLLGNYGFFQIVKLKNERAALEEEIARLKAEHERLVKMKEDLKNDLTTIEQVAREKYRMVKPGEQVYQVVPPERKE